MFLLYHPVSDMFVESSAMNGLSPLDPGLRCALRVRRGLQPQAGHHVVLQRKDHRGRRQVQDQEQRQHQDAHDKEDNRGRRRRVQVSSLEVEMSPYLINLGKPHVPPEILTRTKAWLPLRT